MNGNGVRLRQAVIVASELDPVAEQLRTELGLGEPFADPGVGEFGLRNAVFALGDQFLEIVSPTQEGTAAGRHLERHGGDGGYMVIFQLADLGGARERVEQLGIRVVWSIDLDDISGTHLHPSDMRGAIVSLDRPDPAPSWRWGGPEWEQRSAPGALRGVTIAVSDPEAVQARWTEVLGMAPPGVDFVADTGEAGLTEVAVAIPGRNEGTTEIGGVRFTFVDGEGST